MENIFSPEYIENEKFEERFGIFYALLFAVSFVALYVVLYRCNDPEAASLSWSSIGYCVGAAYLLLFVYHYLLKKNKRKAVRIYEKAIISLVVFGLVGSFVATVFSTIPGLLIFIAPQVMLFAAIVISDNKKS